MNYNSQINIGIIGAGYLGKYHIEQLKKIEKINIVGFYDINKERSAYISNKYSIDFMDIKNLLDKSNAVSIVTPTNTHYQIAKMAIKNGCNIFVEKPITDKVIQSSKLISMAKENKVIIQVGHIERFNPVYQLLNKFKIDPLFIECHRLSKLNKRGNDVSVILDLMIHDIDLICHLKNRDIDRIDSNGVSVVNDTIDIANARITFNDNTIANLTASRISDKNMRKMRIFTEGEYYNADLLNKSLDKYKLNNKGNPEKNCIMQPNDNSNALYNELYNFINAIRSCEESIIDGECGRFALDIALKIQDNIIG